MRAIMETLLDVVYLMLVITIGIRMMLKGRLEKQYRFPDIKGKCF